MSAIDKVLHPSNIDAPVRAFEAALVQVSRVFEVKAALLDVLTPHDADARRPVSGAGRIASRDPKVEEDDEPALYGPAACRRLDARWAEVGVAVNDYVHDLTGYDLVELTTPNAIERCMGLANVPSAHPALYPALMKLWRLQMREVA